MAAELIFPRTLIWISKHQCKLHHIFKNIFMNFLQFSDRLANGSFNHLACPSLSKNIWISTHFNGLITHLVNENINPEKKVSLATKNLSVSNWQLLFLLNNLHWNKSFTNYFLYVGNGKVLNFIISMFLFWFRKSKWDIFSGFGYS